MEIKLINLDMFKEQIHLKVVIDMFSNCMLTVFNVYLLSSLVLCLSLNDFIFGKRKLSLSL